jgi:WD40 repeat protein
VFLSLHPERDEALTITNTAITHWSLATNPAVLLARMSIPPESAYKTVFDPGGRMQIYGGVATAPDGHLFALEQLSSPGKGSTDPCVIELRSWKDFAVSKRFTVSQACGSLDSIDCSPDGRWLVMGTGDPEAIFLLDWQTGEIRGRQATGGYRITGLTFDPTSTFIAGIACHDAWGHLIMWKREGAAANQGSKMAPLDDANDDSTLRVLHWALDRTGIAWPTRDLADTLGTTVFSPDGRMVIFSLSSSYSGCGLELVAYDVASGQRLWCARSEGEGTGACIFTPDGHALLVPVRHGDLLMYSAQSGALLQVLPSGLDKPIQALAFGHDGATLWLFTEETLVRSHLHLHS